MASHRLACVVVAALTVHAASTALGQVGGPPGFMMSWDAAGDSAGAAFYHWDWHGAAPVYGQHTVEAIGTFTGWAYQSGDTALDGSWDVQWNAVFSGETSGENPFVVANIVVTNNNVFQDRFSAQLVVNLDSPMLSPLMRGGIDGTLSDLTFDTATVSAPSDGQVYTPRIDGFDETAGYLMQSPWAESAGALEQVGLGPEGFGLSTPLPASRDAVSQISILLDFNLSAGDSVSLSAFFELLPVPGAGGLPLLALMALTARRRRRRPSAG